MKLESLKGEKIKRNRNLEKNKKQNLKFAKNKNKLDECKKEFMCLNLQLGNKMIETMQKLEKLINNLEEVIDTQTDIIVSLKNIISDQLVKAVIEYNALAFFSKKGAITNANKTRMDNK